MSRTRLAVDSKQFRSQDESTDALAQIQPISVGDDELVLWAESPEEARLFLRRLSDANSSLKIDRIFVAKRSGKTRTNRYLGGEYLETSDDEHVDVHEGALLAPDSICELVQWCTCDAMLSWGLNPIVAVEDTTHIVRMNLYQRIPRLARASESGIPSLILQGTLGLNFTKRGDLWALHRYLKAFLAMQQRFGDASPVPFFFEPTKAGDEDIKAAEMVRTIETLVANDQHNFLKLRGVELNHIAELVASGVSGAPVNGVPCIFVSGNSVTVKIGAKPDKKSWIEKGSGQMDPYIGLIAAAKYMHCYGNDGSKIRNLIVEFTYIPEGFAFFKDGANATALYKRLAYEFADQVVFKG